MKFRRMVIALLAAACVMAYFTKPTRKDFMEWLQPAVTRAKVPPAVEFKDNFLYTSATATYVDIANPVTVSGRLTAPARRENYVGVFGRFWKIDR